MLGERFIFSLIITLGSREGAGVLTVTRLYAYLPILVIGFLSTFICEDCRWRKARAVPKIARVLILY